MLIEASKYHRAMSVFKLGTELLNKLPNRADGPLEVIVKLLAIADSAEKIYGGRSSTYDDIFTRYDLKERTSNPFVKLFFGTGVIESFKTQRIGVNDHLELIEVVDARGERLFFQEYRYGRPEMSEVFFHTPKFDFAAAMDTMWARFPTGLYLSMRRQGYDDLLTFCAVPPPRSDTVSDIGAARLKADVAAHVARSGDPWSFIAYGSPGTGKSTHAVAMAQQTGGRLLKVDAASLPILGVQDFGFLIDAIRPTFLLIDDFDRAPVEETRARVLFLFEHLHASHAGVTVAITVNDASELDPALLRSERIDEAKEFNLPGKAERRDLIGKLIHADVMAAAIRAGIDLVSATDGYSHADIAGLARRAAREPITEVVQAMAKLRTLAKVATSKDKDAKAKKKAEKKASKHGTTPD